MAILFRQSTFSVWNVALLASIHHSSAEYWTESKLPEFAKQAAFDQQFAARTVEFHPKFIYCKQLKYGTKIYWTKIICRIRKFQLKIAIYQ